MDAALLQCGKFQDALAAQLHWLADMEKTVSDLAPLSSDYKYLKSQMQEQKVGRRYRGDINGGIVERVIEVGIVKK